MKLNLGCGARPFEGWHNIDLVSSEADQLVDLNDSWPFEDNSVEEVYCSHVLEHLDDVQFFMDEVHRVCVLGAVVTLRVPHFSSVFNASPFHKHSFCSESMNFFSGVHYEVYGPSVFCILSTVIRWYPYDKIYVTNFKRFVAAGIGRVLDLLINANRHLFEMVWCYWVGGAYEIEWVLEVKK